MAVGSQFARYINPLLAVLKNLGGSARSAEAKAAVAEHLQLSDEVLEEQLESGSSRFENQVSWARYYLARSGHIDSSRRGVWALTEKGRSVDALSEQQIKKLIQDVIAQWGSRTKDAVESTEDDTEDRSPDDAVGEYRTRLLNLLQDLPAPGFERLCQRLLREAGFEQVTVTGRSGDGGIDGIGILELNAFVSFKVLFQCKRYKGSVGPSTVRDFRGAMMGRADKGLILTTGSFTTDSKREAVRDGVPPIELVDGNKLVQLFEQLELGLEPRKTYDLMESFFDEFRD
jgi:restriction system protein